MPVTVCLECDAPSVWIAIVSFFVKKTYNGYDFIFLGLIYHSSAAYDVCGKYYMETVFALDVSFGLYSFNG